MNKQLQDFARKMLREGLDKLPSDCATTFKMMYGRNNGKRSVADALNMPLDDVISEMPEDKLDWAMRQVEKSIAMEKEGTLG